MTKNAACFTNNWLLPKRMCLKAINWAKKIQKGIGVTFGGQPGFFGDPDHLFPPQKIFSRSDLQPKMAFPRNTFPDYILWCLFHKTNISWKHITCVWKKNILPDIRCQNKKPHVPPESSWRQMPQEINEPASPKLGFWLLGVFIVQLLGNGRWLSSRGSEVCQCAPMCVFLPSVKTYEV